MVITAANDFVEKLKQVPPVFVCLAGCFEDPVNRAIADALKCGSHIATANFRVKVNSAYIRHIDASTYDSCDRGERRVLALAQRLAQPGMLLAEGLDVLKEAGYAVVSLSSELPDDAHNDWAREDEIAVLVALQFAPASSA